MIIQDSKAALIGCPTKEPSFEYFIMFIRGLVPNRYTFNSERFLRSFGLFDDFKNFKAQAEKNLEDRLLLNTLQIVGNYVVGMLAGHIYYYNGLTAQNYEMIGYVLYRAFTDAEPNDRLSHLLYDFPTNIVDGISKTFEMLELECEQQTRYAQLTAAFMYENYKQK